MSESSPQHDSDLTSDTLVKEEDRTQPTQEILNALRQLSNSQQSIPGPQPAQDLNQAVSHRDDANPTLSEWESLRVQVREKPSDVDAWLKLVDTAEESGNFERINDTYEALLDAYPNTVCHSLVNISLV